METRTIRISLAVIATVLLVGVLSLLIIESRTVSTSYYVNHAERMRALDSVDADLRMLADGARSAMAEGQRVPAALELALTRLDENRASLQNVAAVPRVSAELMTELERFDSSMQQLTEAGDAFAAQQNALATALQAFQSEAPTLVKYLGEQDLRDASQRVFSLAIDVFELGTRTEASDTTALTARIDALDAELDTDEFAATQVAAFTSAATAIVVAHGDTVTALEQLAQRRAASTPDRLRGALLDLDSVIVSRVERARLLLGVCAVLLLAAAAYAIARLQGSYRELNKVNRGLEERVSERTGQLSQAYDELKESQVQLIHAEKMSSLGEMVAGISHEINTPLWYLMNNSSVLQERLNVMSELCNIADDMLTAARSRTDVNAKVGQGLVRLNRLMNEGLRDDIEEAKDLAQDNIDGLDDLTTLAQGLKDFSRLDRAQHGEFDVNEGLERTLLIAKNKLKNSATVRKHYGTIPKIFCSPSQINQVFLNLLTNAADAIDGHGDIVVHTCEQNGNVEISISDTGCGIPESALGKICNPFFTTKDVGKGTGLGLSIVDRIVTEHAGELRIESEVDKGTTVTVVLPIGTPASISGAEDDLAVDGVDVSLDPGLLPEKNPMQDAVSA